MALTRRTQVVLDLVQLYPGSTAWELMVQYGKRKWVFWFGGEIYSSLLYLEDKGLIRHERHAAPGPGIQGVRYEYYPVEGATA